MSFTSEFEQLYKEKKERDAQKAQSIIGLFNAYSQELAAKQQAPEPSGIEILQAGALDDGFQIADIPKIILGTAGDAAVDLGKGITRFSEGIADSILYGIGDAAKLFGYTDADLRDFRRRTAASTTDQVFGGVDNYLGQHSVLGRTSDAILEGAGQAAAIVGLGGFGAGAGLGTAGTTALTTGASFVSGAGSGRGEAYQGGATDAEARTYGVISGAADAITELIFGGLGKGVKAFGIGKGLSSADDMLAKTLGNKVTKALSKVISNEKVLRAIGNTTELGVKMSAEGAEEVLAGLAQAVGKKITYMSKEDLGKIIQDENLLEQFLVGAATSGIMQAGDLHRANRGNVDLVTGLTQNEHAVVEQEVKNRIAQEQKGGKKLSGKEKSAIYEQVVKDMERGYISTETIESVLGKDALAQYDALSKEAEEFKTLYETEGGKLSEKQKDRLVELKEKNKANPYEDMLKSQRAKISKDVSTLAQSDRLGESYREQTRKGEKFQADVSKYSDAQRKTVQNAIDSGILNNTNRSHEFVDLIAKISADKGISFDFADNAKLKESGFALDGVLVNGFVNENGVTINVQSAKALNRVVGHEITHVLEGTQLYDALQSAVTEYAKGKKEYDSRLKELTELYKGKNANVEQELVADLVGDYLFTDADFIKHLSTEHRNLAQKIYDEIKYLCKIVTAGTKEARQLEKVKKAFADAYRAETKNPTAEGGMKYSLNKDAKNELHKALYDRNYQGEVLLRDESPTIMLAQKGVKNLPMSMKASHIRENVFTEDEAKKLGLRVDGHINYHGLGEDFFLKVIDGLDNVKEAYRGTKNADDASRRENYFLLVSEFTDNDGNIINVPVYINEHALYNRVFIDVNKVSTAFGRTNFRDYINRQIARNNLVRIKNRSNQTSESNAPIARDYGKEASTDSIRNSDGVVNSKNSLSPKGFSIAPPVGADVHGKDIGYDIAPPIPENVPRTNKARPKVGDPAYAPIAEGYVKQSNPDDRMQDVAAIVGDKDTFLSKKAMELYQELSGLSKGVRASKRLGYILDHGYDWKSIKTALLNIRDNPGQVVNENSAAESVAREMLGREYDELVQELSEQNETMDTYVTKMRNIQKELINNERLRAESRADYDGEIERLQAEYDGKKNKTTKAANNLLRRLERLRRMRDNVDADYAKRISNLEERLAKVDAPEYRRAAQRKSKQAEYTSLMKKLVGDISTWVDKKIGLSYKVNTLRRNLRDVVRDASGKRDIARADAIYDELQGKYNHNEAELKRESRRLKAVFAELNLNHAEDTYAHMLGEFQYNPQSVLTEEVVKEFYEKNKGRIDTDKVDTAIAEARKTFDELIVRVNERLKEQGMKEIPYRKGYFPHFHQPKQGVLARLLNWKTVDTEIPTSIAGLTETFNPERSWQSFNKERKTDNTDYSLAQGLDTYIHGALDWIYHIEDIQKRRALENYIRYIHSDEGIKARVDAIIDSEELDADEVQRQIDAVYAEANNPLNNFVTNLRAGTNTLANKKSEDDRKWESDTNRKIYSVMTNLNNRINANMVVGSISSALTNFIPITQSWVEVSPVYSLKGMRDTIKSTIRDDGVVNKSDFLTNRLLNEENLYRTGWDKVSDKAAFMMEAIDSFTSQTVWRSKYLQNISEGMSETQAIKNADQFAENVIAGRSRGNQPTIFDAKNPFTKIFTAFQLEVSNQYGYMFKDAPQDAATKGRLIKGYATAFLGAYVYNALYSSLVGRDAAFDPISIFEDLFRDLGLFGDDEEEEPADVVLNLADNILDEVPFVGGLMGGGRIPISSAIPYSGENAGLKGFLTDVSKGNDESFVKEMLKPLYYLVLPLGGGQIKKTNEGLGMFSEKDLITGEERPITGSYTDSGDLRFPVEDTFGNKLQAGLFGQYASQNARDYFDNGRSPLKTRQTHAFMCTDMSIQDYWAYREGLSAIEADRDEDGKTISGSKKEKVIKYIEDLDISDDAKHILFKYEYPSDDTYNYEIIDYLNSRTDISYTEIKAILEELGFTVDTKGNITWD